VLRKSYLLTQAVGGETLSQFLARYRGHSRSKRAVIRALAHYFRHMHERGVACRDLNADDIVVRQEQNGQYRFSIVDFDELLLGFTSWRRRRQSLVRFVRALDDGVTMTRTEAARFLMSYLGSKNAGRFRRFYKKMAKQLKKPVRPRTTCGMLVPSSGADVRKKLNTGR